MRSMLQKTARIGRAMGVAATVASALATALVISACSPAVPDDPTWTEDVRPILMANCVRCHTVPSIGGAPSYLRLDAYDDWPLDDGTGMIGGAASFAPIVKILATGDEPSMPPISPLTGRQQDILSRWADNGAPRGQPLPGNSGPEMTMEPGVLDVATMTVRFPYEIRDPDGEFVVGMLMADGVGGTETVTYQLHSGQDEAVWDISAVLPGPYQLSAELDDGNERFTVDLGGFDIAVAANPHME